MHVSFLPCIIMGLFSVVGFLFTFISGVLFGTGPDYVPGYDALGRNYQRYSRNTGPGPNVGSNSRRSAGNPRYSGTTGLPMEMESMTETIIVDFSFAVFLVFIVIGFWVNRNRLGRPVAN